MDISHYLDQRKKLIDRRLMSFVPRPDEYTKVIHDAVKYSLMSGGKRIRPIMVLAACEAVSGGYAPAVALACAIEMIHTYTLVHDDLPAMDDDDLRRGRPTTHRVFGEDIAILAGDMLMTLAFEVVSRYYPSKASRLVLEISGSLGIRGVVGGQVADIRSAGKKIGKKELEFISIHKTADLFSTSVRCGAIAGGASAAQINKLTSYARHVGLAFQIIDDILDHRHGVSNDYPGVLGMSEARRAALNEMDAALKVLPSSSAYDRLRQTAVFLAERKK